MTPLPPVTPASIRDPRFHPVTHASVSPQSPGPPPAMGVPTVLPERLLGSRAVQGLPTGEKPRSARHCGISHAPRFPATVPGSCDHHRDRREDAHASLLPRWAGRPALSPLTTVSRGPASMAPSSLPRSLHALTPDSLGGPGARPRARDGSVSGEDRGGGVGAEPSLRHLPVCGGHPSALASVGLPGPL